MIVGLKLLNDRVAAAFDFDMLDFRVNRRADVVVFESHRGKRNHGVELRNRPCGFLESGNFVKQRILYALEKHEFQFQCFFFGAQNLFFDFFKLLGDVAFAGRQSLFSLVAKRHEVGLAFADFEIIAENFVISDFEVFDARGFFFVMLEVRQPDFAFGACRAIAVEFAVISFFDEAAVPDYCGSFLVDCGEKQFLNVLMQVHVPDVSGQKL